MRELTSFCCGKRTKSAMVVSAVPKHYNKSGKGMPKLRVGMPPWLKHHSQKMDPCLRRGDIISQHKVTILISVFTLFGFLGLIYGDGSNIRLENTDQKGRQEKSVAQRVAGREFPSVFQAWNGADNIAEDRLKTIARHDLMWHSVEWFGLEWDKNPKGLADQLRPESLVEGKKKRAALLALNPNMILIAEIRYRDAHRGFLPTDHRWWARDKNGQRKKGWEEGQYFLLDYANPDYRRHVAKRVRAVVESGAVDGVLLDWWQDDDDRLALVKEIRKAIGEDYLILGNANDRITPQTGSYLNGYFMECYRSKTVQDWERIGRTVSWAAKNLRPPRIVCVESWYHKSRDDLNLMRAITTLTLTHSNGYCLFSDPNPLPTADHRHNWYPFWNRSLGKPIGEGIQQGDGTYHREFDRGIVVYNPMGNKEVIVEFNEPCISQATGKKEKKHKLSSFDGDIYLKSK
jgi:putative glycosyl hydrolase-like family 15 (GHL15) protein